MERRLETLDRAVFPNQRFLRGKAPTSTDWSAPAQTCEDDGFWLPADERSAKCRILISELPWPWRRQREPSILITETQIAIARRLDDGSKSDLIVAVLDRVACELSKSLEGTRRR